MDTKIKVIPNSPAKGLPSKVMGKGSGGVSSIDMKKYGRNLARAMNQKSSKKVGRGG